MLIIILFQTRNLITCLEVSKDASLNLHLCVWPWLTSKHLVIGSRCDLDELLAYSFRLLMQNSLKKEFAKGACPNETLWGIFAGEFECALGAKIIFEEAFMPSNRIPGDKLRH